MSKSTVVKQGGREARPNPLNELLIAGGGGQGRQLITQAMEAKLHELLVQHSGRYTNDGTIFIVHNLYILMRDL